MSKKLLKSTSVFSAMTLISRLFGFARDMITAYVFGAGPAVDAFLVANKIPNFMRRLFAEGAFSQAFVPVLSEYRQQRSHDDVRRFINSIAGCLAFVLFIFVIVAEIFTPEVVRLFAPGFAVGSPRFIWASDMLRVTTPYLMLVSLAAFVGAILNAYDRFAISALAPVFMNISLISAAFLALHFSPGHPSITWLAWGVLVAGFLQLFFQLPFLHRQKLLPIPRVDFSDPGVRKVLRLMIPAIVGVSVAQINLFVDTVFASFLPVGSVSWLYYADRLMNLPLGVFGVAIATVILPHLSRKHADDAKDAYSNSLDWALRMVFLIGAPAAVALAVLSHPILVTLFQHGRFNEFDVQMTERCLMAFAIGVCAFMLAKALASGFYAKQNLKTPVRVAVVCMIANIIFIAAFMTFTKLDSAGLALATSLAGLLNVLLLWVLQVRKGYYKPAKAWGLFLFRMIFSNGLMGAAIYFSSRVHWSVEGNTIRVVHLGGVIVLGMLVYVAALWLTGLRVRDLKLDDRYA